MSQEQKHTSTEFNEMIERNATKFVTFRLLGVVVEGINALKQRIKELEATSMRFEGVHQRDKAYGQGAAVVRQGGLWIALRATSGTPGGPDAADRDWQLAVKRGSVV